MTISSVAHSAYSSLPSLNALEGEFEWEDKRAKPDSTPTLDALEGEFEWEDKIYSKPETTPSLKALEGEAEWEDKINATDPGGSRINLYV